MKWIGSALERFGVWQERVGSRMLLSALAVLLVSGAVVPLWWSSLQHAQLVGEIVGVLREANIQERNQQAVNLVDRGLVQLNGREVGGARVQAVALGMFNESGTVDEIPVFASFIAATQAPRWAPPQVVEQPMLVGGIGIGIACLAVMAIWLGLSLSLVGITLVTAPLATACFVLGQMQLFVAFTGIGVLLFLFLVATQLALRMLSPAGAITGIAHTLLLEATRQKISVACIAGLLVLLPLLPLFISSQDPLRYQVQTFIARGSGLVFLVAAFLTLLLACATVAFEIRDRQIWSVLTKPVSRLQYLAGKWLGLAVLNGLILSVAGMAVLVQVSLISARPAGSVEDAAALNNQVLVARATERPAYKSIDPIELRDSVNREIENDSVLRGEIEAGAKSEADVVRQLRVQKVTEFSTAQRTIAAGASRSYSFSGLLEARKAGITPMLRYTFHSGPDSSHEVYPVSFLFGDLPPVLVDYVPVQRNVIGIPVEAIAEDGTLRVTIVNGAMMEGGRIMQAPWSMNFDADGLEVLHRVGNFEGNFLRAMLVDWGKLLFIAALGISAAGILSFPVAVLVAMTVFIVGSMSPFLEVAVEQYAVPTDAPWFMQVFEMFIRGFVGSVQWLLAPFASVGSSTDLVDGRVIPWGSVVRALGLIGLLWSALAFAIGGWAFSRKEIAIYSGGEG
ncbi:MAG: hypothetical protein FJ285_04830 [Planctomycetes bacterium]|nr:hypothetical protein [Planctomycetota bacterium]